jgi:hypothetical protein
VSKFNFTMPLGGCVVLDCSVDTRFGVPIEGSLDVKCAGVPFDCYGILIDGGQEFTPLRSYLTDFAEKEMKNARKKAK